MKRKTILLMLLTGLLFAGIRGSAQTTNAVAEELNKRASVPIPSPNVAALNKFVEFPVSYFNGQVNVEIPVYEIKLKNVSVPITLKYHTGGIRVSEEASWVGLGWALDAGGVISHQVRGLDDLVYPHYRIFGLCYPYQEDPIRNTTYDDNSILGAFAKEFHNFMIPNENGTLVDRTIALAFPPEAGNGQSPYHDVDGDPDMYIYNAGNYSGKYINWNNQPIDLSCNNMKFAQYVGNVHTADSIIATTPEGVVYKFKDIEASFSLTGVTSPEQNNGRMNTAAYYLSEIIAPNGEQIKFIYKTFKQLITDNNWISNFPDFSYGKNPSYMQAGYYPSLPALFEESSYIQHTQQGQGVNYNNTRLRSYTFTNILYLEKIEFPNGSVEFIKSPRLDAYGLKIDKIYVKNHSGQKIKTFRFQYEYFDGQQPSMAGTDVMSAADISTSADINYPENYLKKRLKLISFAELDNPNESRAETYRFAYNESVNFPYKTSFAQDFWGYYNGQTINPSLFPSYQLYASSFGLPSDFGQGITGN
jgi:hypothetical protein